MLPKNEEVVENIPKDLPEDPVEKMKLLMQTRQKIEKDIDELFYQETIISFHSSSFPILFFVHFVK